LISSSTTTFLKQSEKLTTTIDCNTGTENTKTDIDQETESATASIRNLMKNYSKVSDCDSNIKYIEEALDRVMMVTKSVLIPSEIVLRDFFECVIGLDPIAELVVDRAVQYRTTKSWVALCSFFSLLGQLAMISGYWRNRINILFGDDLVSLLSNCKSSTPGEKTEVLEKLKQSSFERRKSFSITPESDQVESKYRGLIEPVRIEFH